MSGSVTRKTRKRGGREQRLATAVGIDYHDTGFRVRLSDGRTLDFDYDHFEFLRQASPEKRIRGIVDDKGTVLWWEDLLEGISVAGITGVSESELEEFAGVYR